MTVTNYKLIIIRKVFYKSKIC